MLLQTAELRKYWKEVTKMNDYDATITIKCIPATDEKTCLKILETILIMNGFEKEQLNIELTKQGEWK